MFKNSIISVPIKKRAPSFFIRIFLLIIPICFLANISWSQNTDNIKAAINAARKIYTWDLQKSTRGTMMFLDAPYQRNDSSKIKYLTLAVAKEPTKKRPDFISVIVPNYILQANGIFIMFSKTVLKNGHWTSQLEKGKPVRIHFEGCNSETCTARMIGGYANKGENKVDIFQKFLTYDNVYFLLIYPDGSHKTVAVPLFSFKKQYKKLVAEK